MQIYTLIIIVRQIGLNHSDTENNMPISKAPFIHLFVWVFCLVSGYAFAQTNVIHHELTITPEISEGKLTVDDKITIPDQLTSHHFDFALNKNFSVHYQGKPLTPYRKTRSHTHYRVRMAPEQKQIALNYSGDIPSTPQCQWTRETCSLLNKDGIFLGPGLAWYPIHHSGLQTFNLHVALPEKWRSLSQGMETSPNHWQADKPQDAIYLLAGKFHVYEKPGKTAKAMVYLLSDDEALAQKYLNATEQYLSSYSEQLGAYPYGKFATVESFWESGWGMPSFTLLGSRVLRLPFILYTSFPHEILHNWWGNGVYIDSAQGNWSEGLTAYLADHALKEQRGKGAEYRRDALQKYATFAKQDNDFPISEFRSRHNNVTQAVGYSKLLMVYHMIRKDMGDEAFFQGLQNFFKQYQFQYATMNELLATLSQVAKKDLLSEYAQWLTQTDAPTLSINTWKQIDKNEIELNLAQRSSQSPFKLSVPVHFYQDDALLETQQLKLDKAEQGYTLTFPKNTTRLAIDPEFDVLRKPSAQEIPASLHRFRDRTAKAISITPNAENKDMWKKLGEELTRNNKRYYSLKEGQTADTEHVIFQLGLATNATAKHGKLQITETEYQLGDQNYARNKHSLIFIDHKPEHAANIAIEAPDEQQARTLFRKAVHYGKYSYLIFDENGKNVAKGQWDISNSPLQINLKTGAVD
ncbi:MAG: PDZ domain [uncultured Thiotrichaceae bacterium]|uniref:PDZ domain n=1 Tax=uncultured Thiotrichaceae bacterium TaxID=298394 RepID=A0A6S6UH36_9GAMM|nr:MAG: PDZ domain [uncultured Thiotrichaceae bacterium]